MTENFRLNYNILSILHSKGNIYNKLLLCFLNTHGYQFNLLLIPRALKMEQLFTDGHYSVWVHRQRIMAVVMDVRLYT